MLQFHCDRCGKELDQAGALLFGPPLTIGAVTVVKYHVCKKCWPKLVEWLFDLKRKR